MDGKILAFAMYLTFYILFAFLFLLSISSLLCRCYRGPAFVLFATNQHPPCGGLHPSVIESFPKYTYSNMPRQQDDGNTTMMKMSTGDCVVCLGAFEENETLRLMPMCGHVFHVDCIDAWLRAHDTCPFCWANLRTGVGPGEPPPDGGIEVAIDINEVRE